LRPVLSPDGKRWVGFTDAQGRPQHIPPPPGLPASN
jgi:hypothetical protein